MRKKIYHTQVKSRWGKFILSYTDKGIFSLSFPKKAGNKSAAFRETKIPVFVKKAKLDLQKYLRGSRVDFRKLPIDYQGYTLFQKRVLKRLQKVHPGHQISYQTLARQVRNPRAARAIGNVMNSNRIPIIIPCHRVIRANGGLGGFLAGPAWKRRLLKIEHHHKVPR